MRLDPTATNIALAGLVAASVGLWATRKSFIRSWAVTLFTLAALDLVANLSGLGAWFWWSPLHMPSTCLLGFDEILENHGVIKTTGGYLLDLVAWSAAIALGISIWKRRKGAPAAPPPPPPNA